MSELDHRQATILDNWKNGLYVPGFNRGEFGIEHAMINAVSGEKSAPIAHSLKTGSRCSAGLHLDLGVQLVARELAAAHMGYPYLQDAEEAMKTKSITDFGVTIKSRTEAEIYYDIGGDSVSYDIDVVVDYTPAEPEAGNYPGCQASVELIGVVGLSVAERQEWDKYLSKNLMQIEEDLLNMCKQEMM